MTVDNVMVEMEKFFIEKNIVLFESEKRHLEQLLEDLRQTSYDDGFDAGYSSGYDEGYDFALTPVD